MIILLGANEKQPVFEKDPKYLFSNFENKASAASSIIFKFLFLHIFNIFLILLPLPEICTGITNLVFLLIFFN